MPGSKKTIGKSFVTAAPRLGADTISKGVSRFNALKPGGVVSLSRNFWSWERDELLPK